MERMTIGKLAKKADVSTDTIRFYERCRLIAEPARTESNYRLYPEEDVKRIRFIKKAKSLGFTLSEIGKLLSMRHSPSASKADVKMRFERKIRSVQQKIDDLSRILNALEHLAAACDGRGEIGDCTILHALDGQTSEE